MVVDGFANMAMDLGLDATFDSVSALPRSIHGDITLDAHGSPRIRIS